MFGTYDQAQLQRGFKVYHEVCSTCHRLSIPFRTLGEPDGPGFSEEQVKALAATYKVTNDAPNDKGEIFKRPGMPSDDFPPPEAYPNDGSRRRRLSARRRRHVAARQGAQIRARLPLVRLRRAAVVQYQEVGADYIYAILNGYTHQNDPQWNLYFPATRSPCRSRSATARWNIPTARRRN